jgi:hypothetical protein
MRVERRGRPSEAPVEVKTKWERTYYEYPTKPELGSKTIWFYDNKKSISGPYKVEITDAKDTKYPKLKIDQKMYGGLCTVMVFKTSNRSNAQTKMKIFNKNVDYIMSAKTLPGVPENAIILELGVGASCIASYKQKYDLN